MLYYARESGHPSYKIMTKNMDSSFHGNNTEARLNNVDCFVGILFLLAAFGSVQ
jgi:hypothetical protein